MSIAVGIDPSLTCSGVAIIDTTTGGVHTRRVKTKPSGSSLLATRNRLRDVVDGILAPIPARVGVTVIELPNSSNQFGAHAERHALTWWLIDQLFARGPVVAVTPTQRAKLATGNGRATKTDVVGAMRAAHPTVVIPDDNVADAVALAISGAHWLGQAANFNTGQAAAYARLAWPS